MTPHEARNAKTRHDIWEKHHEAGETPPAFGFSYDLITSLVMRSEASRALVRHLVGRHEGSRGMGPHDAPHDEARNT